MLPSSGSEANSSNRRKRTAGKAAIAASWAITSRRLYRSDIGLLCPLLARPASAHPLVNRWSPRNTIGRAANRNGPENFAIDDVDNADSVSLIERHERYATIWRD